MCLIAAAWWKTRCRTSWEEFIFLCLVICFRCLLYYHTLFELFCSCSFGCYLPAFYSHWFLSQTLFGAFAKSWKATISFFMSVRPSVCPSTRLSTWNKSAPIERILMKFDICVVFEKLSQNSSLDKNKRYFTRKPLEIFDNFSLNSS